MSRYLNCDKPFHKAMEQCKDVLFRPLIENYEYYYAENKLYVIRDKRNGVICLSYGKSPNNALDRIQRPHLCANQNDKEEMKEVQNG